MPVISEKTLFLNADRTQVVDEGSDDAAFLLVRAGSELNDQDAQRYGISGAQPMRYNAKVDHFEKHGGMDPQADPREQAARARMFSGEDDPDGPAAPGERGTLNESAQEPAGDGPREGDMDTKAMDQPRETKAVGKPPANKGR